MAHMDSLTVGKRVKYVANGILNGAIGTVTTNRSGIYQKDGFVWITWDNPDDKIELVPQWITQRSVRII